MTISRFHAGLAAMVLLAVSTAQADVERIQKRDVATKVHQSKAAKGEKPNKARTNERTGEQALIDSSGLEYFINSDITFSTSSSASGAASEATYTAAVSATTSGGGTVSTTLSDAFDGYNTICLSFSGSTGPCTTGGGGEGNPQGGFSFYNDNGAGTLDAACSNRQVLLNTQAIGGLNVSRRIFVPTNDAFARWLNIFENPTGAPISFTMITGNNLGSDANTVLVTTADGDGIAEPTDNWATSFQQFSVPTAPNGVGTSSDVRLGHVFQGPGAPIQMNGISFVNGDDNPFWSYAVTVPAGGRIIIMNFATGQPSRAAAAAKSAELVGLPDNAVQCMTEDEVADVANFVAGVPEPPVVTIPTLDTVGLAVLALALALGSVAILRRRARA
jgi:hypothetical protein